jgi:hypothetical protein
MTMAELGLPEWLSILSLRIPALAFYFTSFSSKRLWFSRTKLVLGSVKSDHTGDHVEKSVFSERAVRNNNNNNNNIQHKNEKEKLEKEYLRRL